MRQNRAKARWTPEEEEREFHRFVGEGYIRNCLETKSEADRAAEAAFLDRLVARYFGRPTEGASAVDVGAGEGWATSRLRELGFDAVGVERSPIVAARAEDGSVLVGNAESLPLEDESQDFVICNSIFEHVLDPDQVLAEVARVLKLGGVAVLTTTNRWHWRTGEIHIPFYSFMPYRMRDYLWRRSGRGHITPHYFSYRQMRRMAASHGLQCETAITVTLRGPRRASTIGRVARVAYRIPVAHFLMDATMNVVRVRLIKPVGQ